jgi:TRAP-type C4-dicarboxylate transport system substrate-binding protein
MAKKIRWIIAHHPRELFIRTANQFIKELEELCPGEFELEIHTPQTFNKQYDNKMPLFNYRKSPIKNLEDANVPNNIQTNDSLPILPKGFGDKWEQLFDVLEEGEFEMTQTPVAYVGSYCSNDFVGLDLPFLFRDHDHVSNVLDNEIGNELLSDISKNRDLVGLSFTYSGGYRIIGSTEPVASIEDLKKIKMFSYTKPGLAFFDMLGIPAVKVADLDKDDLAEVDHVASIETTYLRFTGKNILKTNHSMYMTTIISSKKFIDSLTTYQQECFNIAAKKVAKMERSWSVEDAAKFEENAAANGVTIRELSSIDKNTLKVAAKKTYASYKKISLINGSLIKKIILK